MSCKICGRNNCCETFHSLEEQEQHEKYADKSVDELIRMCKENDEKIEWLENDIVELEKKIKKK